MECTIYITDDSGRRFWPTSVTYGVHTGERRNILRHLEAIRAHRYPTCEVDPRTARMVIEVGGRIVESTSEVITQDDVDLLAGLLC